MLKRWRPHILVLCLVAGLHLIGLTGIIQTWLSDYRVSSITRPASGTIALVALDAPSLDRIGVWPWPRSLHGTLVKTLERAGVGEIYFDIDFSAASRPDEDAQFAKALADSQLSIVLPTFQQSVGTNIHVNRPNAQFSASAWPALVNVRPDEDGVVRSYPLGEKVDGEFVPSMAALAAGQLESSRGEFLIDFGIQPQSVPTVSYADVLEGKEAALKLLANKKVIIGATAVELGDRFTTPRGHITPGPILQILAAESLLQNRAISSGSVAFPVSLLVGLTLLMFLYWKRAGPVSKVFCVVFVAMAVEVSAAIFLIFSPVLLQTGDLHVAAGAYAIAIALDEIDLRDLLSSIASSRFDKIAMSLGDALVCTDHDLKIRVWNPGAESIFGCRAKDVLGKPLTILFADPLPIASMFGSEELSSTSQTQPVIELTGIRQTGERFPSEARFSRWQGSDGPQTGLVIRDVTERKREAERIRYLAEFDTLTGLPNRHSLSARLQRLQSEGVSDEVALVMVGIDDVEKITDVHGQAYGDALICGAAERIKSLVHDTELVARISPDLFVVLVRCEFARIQAENVARTIVSAFQSVGVFVDGHSHRLNAAVGLAYAERIGAKGDDLLSNAHLALLEAKRSNVSDCIVYDERFRVSLQKRLKVEAELYRALARNEFELFYQPQIRFSDGKLVGAEALIRWRHPERGLVPPGEFIPVANASPVSEGISRWVLRTAVIQARDWYKAGHPVRVGINLSPSQMRNGGLAETVKSLLSEFECPAAVVELEVTEDILLANDAIAIECLRDLKNMGVSIAFDDFGTGYASLSYLKKFPLDTLKLDRSFVSNLWSDPHNMPIVRMTAGLCNALGLSLIAEGIEDAETAGQLAAIGCTEGQGYHYGRPTPAREFEERFLRPNEMVSAA